MLDVRQAKALLARGWFTLAACVFLLEAMALGGCTKKEEPVLPAEVIPDVDTVPAGCAFLKREIILPGEILPYQDVPVYPKISGFIDKILVDRGSIVKKGQLLVKLVAPELSAQEQEAEARALEARGKVEEAKKRLASARALKLEAQAKTDADDATYMRLRSASLTPGVVAENDVHVAEKTVEADRQMVNSRHEMVKAAQAQVRSASDSEEAALQAVHNVKDLESYLVITAPYDGVITERNMHEGSLAYPPSGPGLYPPMLRIKENSLLRIVIPVPEIAVGDVPAGSSINFSVSAYPGRIFTGTVARIAHSLDVKTRTMPVELNYFNPGWLIAPGMFPEVRWPMRRNYPTLFVPSSAVAVSLEKPFVIRVRNGVTQWVDVKRGQTMGNRQEIFGDLDPEDQVVLRASDEIGNGIKVNVHPSSADSTDRLAPDALGDPSIKMRQTR